MTTVTLAEAKERLEELIEKLGPGEAIVVVRNAQPIARITAQSSAERPREPGCLKGMVTIVSDDDDHLADFHEYMQ